jgi:hypothetical protein
MIVYLALVYGDLKEYFFRLSKSLERLENTNIQLFDLEIDG